MVRLFLLLTLLPAGLASAQDGRLDPTFYADSKGVKRLDDVRASGESSYGFGGRMLEDGSLILAKVLHEGDLDRLALVRYTPDGVLDRTFGSVAGRRARYYEPDRLTPQPDGSYLVAGYAEPIRDAQDPDAPSPPFSYFRAAFIARFLPGGQPDSTFGIRGVALFELYSRGVSYPYTVKPQRNGRLVVAGGYHENGCHDCATLIRLMPDGTRDLSFGTNGFTLFDPLDGDEAFFDLAVLPDDRILVAGVMGGRFGVARFTPEGALDPSFGSGGYVVTPDYGKAYTLIVQPDGRLLAAGYVVTAPFPTRFTSTPIVARFLPDGQPDPTFGNGGSTRLGPSGPGYHFAWGLVTRPDGSMFVAGDDYNLSSLTSDYFVARLTASGALDPSFGDGGRTFLDVGYGEEHGYGLAILPHGGLVGVGTGWENGSLFMTRLRADGRPEPVFAGAAVPWQQAPGLYRITGLASTPEGYLYVSGLPRTGGQSTLRLRPDGTPDPSYFRQDLSRPNVSGDVGISRSGALLMPNGALVLADDRVSRGLRAVRLQPDGRIDSSFSEGGIPSPSSQSFGDKAQAVAAAPDGGFALAGRYGNWFAVARLLADGKADPTFGTGGLVRLTTPDGNTGASEAVTVLPDRRIVAAGSIGGRFTVVRLNTDGTLDTGFATAGRFTWEGTGTAYAVAAQPDGTLLVAGTLPLDGSPRFVVLRLLPNGTPDPGFGQQGLFVLPPGHVSDAARVLLLLPDGGLLAGGLWNAQDSYTGQTLVRLTPAGTLDASFGDGGVVHNDFGAARALTLMPGDRLVVGSAASSRYPGVLTAYTFRTAPVGIDALASTDGRLHLSAPYPNPAQGTVRMTLAAAAAQQVEVDLLDLLGRRVARLHTGPGAAEIRFDTDQVSPGVYFVLARSLQGQVLRMLTVVR